MFLLWCIEVNNVFELVLKQICNSFVRVDPTFFEINLKLKAGIPLNAFEIKKINWQFIVYDNSYLNQVTIKSLSDYEIKWLFLNRRPTVVDIFLINDYSLLLNFYRDMYYLEALSMNELHLLVNDLENESIQFILERDLLNHEEL